MYTLLEEAHCSELQLLEVVQSSILQLVLRNYRKVHQKLYFMQYFASTDFRKM